MTVIGNYQRGASRHKSDFGLKREGSREKGDASGEGRVARGEKRVARGEW